MKTKIYFLITFIFCVGVPEMFAQLNVSNFPPVTNGSPTWLIENVLIGANSGIQVSNVHLSVGDSSIQVGFFDGTASNINLPSGILLTTGDIAQAPGSGTIGNNADVSVSSANTDADLELLLNNTVNTNDAVVLEFDFIATRSSYAFNYVFASEEYEEYVCSQFNDVFGFFLSGPGISGPYSNNATNVALVPGKAVPVSINTVNQGTSGVQGSDANCSALDTSWFANSIYYVSNDSNISPQAIEFDGFTVPLKAVLSGLICGQTYHIKLAIADASDQIFDSGVFLEKGSFTTNVFELGITTSTGQLVNTDSAIVEGCDSLNLLVIRPDTSGTDTLPIVYSGTAISGFDYSTLPNQVIFAPGVDTVVFSLVAILDGSIEGLENLTITIPASTGTCLADSSSIDINIYDSYNSFLTYTDETCGSSNGSIQVTTNATVAASLIWNDGDTNTSRTGLAAGLYSVTITDIAGCSQVLNATLNNVSLDSVIVTLDSAILCNGSCNGAATVFISGGILPYSYQWNDVNNQTTATAVGLCAGSYMIIVTDSVGCSISDSIIISEPLALQVSSSSTDENCGQSDGSACITITGGAAPYLVNWSTGDTSSCITNVVAGAYFVTVIDNNGCNYTDTVVVSANNASCCNYEVVSSDTICPGTTTCVWLEATQTVTNGIIGMNYCLSYDTLYFSPTGNANLGQVVYNAIGQGNGESVQLNTSIPGQVFATIFYNSGVPSGSFWQGSGEVICIEFNVDANTPTGAYNFSACEVEEAFELFEVTNCATPGNVYVGANSFVNGEIYYWNYDGTLNGPERPLMYDVNNPSDHLITTINAANGSGAVETTDLNGDFVWNAQNGHQVIIDRDIIGSFYDTTCTDVFPFINGADAYLAALINNFDQNNILDSNALWIPNKYQMVAGDVNMNDKVRANDVTHIMSRSVRSICEFPQVWNYTFGTPASPLPDTTLGVSKDWRFLPAADSLALIPADWNADVNYPVFVNSNATGGYWRDDVPSVPDTIDLFTPDTSTACPNYDDRAFEAVLLGDLTGSWDPTSSLNTGVRASSTGAIHFDIFPKANTINGYTVDVSYEHSSSRASVDFRMDYNKSNVTITNVYPSQIANNANLKMEWNDFSGEKLYVSSYTLDGVNTTDVIYTIELTTSGAIDVQDLGSILPILNGEIVNSDVTLHTVSGVSDTYSQAGYFNVYPNPSNGFVNIEYALAQEGTVQLDITNVLGQVIFSANLGNMSTLTSKTLDLTRFETGIYNIRLSSEQGEIVKKIILE